jgi:hypothetical protein
MDTYSIIAQANPSSGVLLDIYVADKPTVISSIIICNTGTTQAKFSIMLAKKGEGLLKKHYIYHNLPLTKDDTFIATIGCTLSTDDRVRVTATTNDLAFNLVGVKVD